MKARLLREVDGSDFFSQEVVATFDKENNLIRVRRDWWREQSAWVQRAVWKTDVPYLLETDFVHLQQTPFAA